MPEPIPKDWRETVIRILRTQDSRRILWTKPARQRWAYERFGADNYEAYDAMIQALQDNAIGGNETTSMEGQIATYEFLFQHRKQRIYGKIALLNDRVRILVVSAHPAERPTLSP